MCIEILSTIIFLKIHSLIYSINGKFCLLGTMSGGGNRVSRGIMGTSVVECTHTPEEVKAMSQEVDTLSKNLTETRRSILNLQERVSKITKELSGLKLSVRKRQSNHKV